MPINNTWQCHIQDLTHLQVWLLWKTTISFLTQMSWVSSCSVMARSFPCHNKVSGPRQHFLKTETLQQLQWIMCCERWDSSAHHLSRVPQTRTTQARVSWMVPIYLILPPFTDWFPFFPTFIGLLHCITFAMCQANWVARLCLSDVLKTPYCYELKKQGHGDSPQQ